MRLTTVIKKFTSRPFHFIFKIKRGEPDNNPKYAKKNLLSPGGKIASLATTPPSDNKFNYLYYKP